MATPAVRLIAISKAFEPGRKALDRVSLDLERGAIHALLGENGAGKSTLMNVLVGLVRPDAGSLEVGGQRVAWERWNPALASRARIAMVHQHSTLIPALTVAENFALGDSGAGWLHRERRVQERVAQLATRFVLEVPPQARTRDLSVGERQRAEVLRALDRGAEVLILDEPTAVLTPGESEALFAALRRVRDAGRAVVFITHKLDEIRAVADLVTVLRRGRKVATLAAGEASGERLARLMLGRDLAPLARPPARRSRAPRLRLRGLCVRGLRETSRLRDLELEVFGGEIVGIAGIDGNGQQELEEVLAGVRTPERGRLEVDGTPVAFDPRALRRAGVGHLSGERERAGLVAGFTVAENLVLKGSYDDRRFFRRGWIDRQALRRHAVALARRFAIDPPDPERPVDTLSGGNAQKVLVARELEATPAVLVAVNPTRGLDVGSARFVHERILALRAAGTAIVLVSTELDEVLSLADRVVALVRGRLRAVPPGADRARLGTILLGEGDEEMGFEGAT